ncbi:MAG TPA: hypothetical protein VFR64_19130 [Methylomirabilota bacterium]|nr:hypothetical protein [Methylomirabilota bacterium]
MAGRAVLESLARQAARKKLGQLDNHEQEPWKARLAEFIERLYLKRFGRRRPDVVVSIEERARVEEDRKARKREIKARGRW